MYVLIELICQNAFENAAGLLSTKSMQLDGHDEPAYVFPAQSPQNLEKETGVDQQRCLSSVLGHDLRLT